MNIVAIFELSEKQKNYLSNETLLVGRIWTNKTLISEAKQNKIIENKVLRFPRFSVFCTFSVHLQILFYRHA